MPQDRYGVTVGVGGRLQMIAAGFLRRTRRVIGIGRASLDAVVRPLAVSVAPLAALSALHWIPDRSRRPPANLDTNLETRTLHGALHQETRAHDPAKAVPYPSLASSTDFNEIFDHAPVRSRNAT